VDEAFIDDSPRWIGAALKQNFEGHGISASLDRDGRLTFPLHPKMWVIGDLFQIAEKIVQLNVSMGGFDGDRTLIESVVGVGDDLNTQVDSALLAFGQGTFHVLLSAFFGLPECHGTERELTTIDGHRRELYIGLCTSRFGPPLRSDGTTFDLEFFNAFKSSLKKQSLPSGTHWIRLYHMRHRGQSMGNEVLFDNGDWPAMQETMAAFRWPVSEKHYDVRIFLIIKDSPKRRWIDILLRR
jgi:Family of unknown function (DUF6348)